MTRRKSPALQAPQTLEEAIILLATYAAISSELDQIEVDRAAAKAQIDATADKMAAPMQESLKQIVLRLRPWWAVAGDTLTEGKRKSIELAGCLLGIRTSTPKLGYPGNEQNAVGLLSKADLDAYLRVKTTLDKQGLLRALTGDDPIAAQLAELGFARRQREEFFVDRIPPKEPATEQVEAADGEEALA